MRKQAANFRARGIFTTLLQIATISMILGALNATQAQNITFWHGWTGGNNAEALNEVVTTYNATNEMGVTIEPTPLPWDQLFSKWVLSAAARQLPDVVMLHPTEAIEFANRGLLQPLDDLIDSSGLDISSLPESMITSSTFEGELVCLPLDSYPMGMYYNIDMVEAAGLDPNSPPQTGEELLEWAQALTVRDGSEAEQYGIYLPVTGAVPRWLWHSLLYQYGGSFLDDEGNAAVNSEASQQALQFMVDLIYEQQVAASGQMGEAADPRAAGRAAIWFTGPWEVNLRLEQGLNIGTAPMPTIGEQPASWMSSHCIGLSKEGTEESRAAGMDFISWFFTNYAVPAQTVGVIPLSPTAQTSEEFVDGPLYPYYLPFQESLEIGVAEPILLNYTTVFSYEKPTPLAVNIEAALSQSKTVEQALNEANAGIDAQLTDQ